MLKWQQLFFPLINVKMPTIVGILTFMSVKNFMLSCVEHIKSFGLNIFISFYNYTSIQIYMMIIQAMGLERKPRAYKVLLPKRERGKKFY